MTRKFVLLISLSYLLLSLSQAGQAALAAEQAAPSAEELFGRALKHYDAGEYKTAAESALEVAGLFRDTPWEGRALFLAGRAYASDNDLDAAASVFGNAGRRYPILADYAAYLLAAACRKASHYDEAAAGYTAVAEGYPESPLAPDSLLCAGGAYVELGRYTYAIGCLKRFLDMKGASYQTAQARYLLMSAYAALDNMDAAREQYRVLWLYYPGDPSSNKAESLAVKLAKEGVAMPEPDYKDYTQRAGRLYDHGLFRAASKEYIRALELPPPDTGQPGETLLKLGLCYYRLRENGLAEALFKGALDNEGQSRHAPEALYWLVRTYLRTDDQAGIRDSALACAYLYPDSPRAVDCLYLLGVTFASAGDYDTAIEIFKQMLELYPGSERVDEVLWQTGWANLNKGEYTVAADAFERLAKTYPDSELAAQGLYWQAKALEAQGRQVEAQAVYAKASSEYGLSYYGLLSRRPGGLYETGGPDTYPITPVPETRQEPNPGPFTDTALERAVELGIQGMRPEGVMELKGAEKRYRMSLEKAMEISGVYGFLGEYKRPLELVGGLFGETVGTGRGSMPGEALGMVFPLAYWDVIRREAEGFEVDPLLICALIREESRFDRTAVSGAGAVGLMQLMPGTAKMICRRLKVGYGSSEELKEEGFNVPLGVCYLKSLLDRHEGRLVYALAEYNAGPEPLARWINKRPVAKDDEFIENIGYYETRNYVKRVMRNYMLYHKLYGTDDKE